MKTFETFFVVSSLFWFAFFGFNWISYLKPWELFPLSPAAVRLRRLLLAQIGKVQRHKVLLRRHLPSQSLSFHPGWSCYSVDHPPRRLRSALFSIHHTHHVFIAATCCLLQLSLVWIWPLLLVLLHILDLNSGDRSKQDSLALLHLDHWVGRLENMMFRNFNHTFTQRMYRLDKDYHFFCFRQRAAAKESVSSLELYAICLMRALLRWEGWEGPAVAVVGFAATFLLAEHNLARPITDQQILARPISDQQTHPHFSAQPHTGRGCQRQDIIDDNCYFDQRLPLINFLTHFMFLQNLPTIIPLLHS